MSRRSPSRPYGPGGGDPLGEAEAGGDADGKEDDEGEGEGEGGGEGEADGVPCGEVTGAAWPDDPGSGGGGGAAIERNTISTKATRASATGTASVSAPDPGRTPVLCADAL